MWAAAETSGAQASQASRDDSAGVIIRSLERARRRNLVGDVRGRRVVDLGTPAVANDTPVRLAPRRQRRAVLRPVDDRGLVAPVEELLHGAGMDAGDHER